MDIVPECRSDSADHGIPSAGSALPKLSQTRIPGAVITVEQPAPSGIVAIEEPQWLAECAGEVRHRGIYGDDEVEIVD